MLLLGALVVPFFAIAAAIFLAGGQKTSTATHGSTTSTGFWQFLSSGLLKTLFGQVSQATRSIISHFAAAQLVVLAKWLLAMGTLSAGWFSASAVFSEAITEALERVEHRGDPKARAKAAGAAAAAKAAARTAHKGVQIGHSNAATQHHYQTKTDARIKPIAHATAIALPHDIARVRQREDALSRDAAALKERTKALEDGAEKTWEWIRSHPLTGVTGVFTGAVAIALARMGFGFLRCRNWQNVGKNLTCGMGAWVLKLLELIAGFGLAIFSVLDPEALAQEAVSLVDTVEPLLSEILKN